jgi:serine/threonine protein kinase
MSDEGLRTLEAMSTPERIGPWAIIGRLDHDARGGNADVYLARDDGREVALKVLRTKNAQSEPYGRFRNEIEVLRRFQDDPGVLPILDAFLPERPNKGDLAWIAMPQATLIRDGIEGLTLREKVEAVETIASTLARLAEHGVAHRDLKPDNLYRYEDRWAVGDFGLARLPEESDRGMTGSRLGAFGYMPDELFTDALNADAFRADVFQLAKCLLVLASGLTDPPQGHIPAGSSGALSRYVVDARVDALDQIIDRCSRREPEYRPTMTELAHELQAWLEYEPPGDSPDLGDLMAQFRATHRDSLDTRDLQDEWARRLSEIVRQLESTTLQWVEDRFGEAGLNPRMASYHERHQSLERRRALGSTPGLVADQRWVEGEIGQRTWPTKVIVGIGVDVNENGEFWLTAYGAYGDLRSTATRSWDREDVTAPIESIEVEALLEAVDADVKEATVGILREMIQRGQRS